MSKFTFHKKNEELERSTEILSDFLKDFDMKKLIAAFFVKLYNANLFKGYRRTDELSFTFPFGRYEYRIQRHVLDSNDPIIQQVLNNSQNVLDNNKIRDNMLKL